MPAISKPIGLSFATVADRAGILGLKFSWSTLGAWSLPGLSDADWARVAAVVAAYDASAPLPVIASDLTAYAAAKRYAVEVAGVAATIGGQSVVVSTARDMRDGMRDTMLRILVGLRKDGDALKIFADGVPRAATNAEAAAMIGAASNHVQAAFNVEEVLVAAINANPPSITTLAQIDAATWPVASG